MCVTVKSIMREWLLRNGYDGLVNGDAECGCRVIDGLDPSPRFMECIMLGDTGQCEPAYQREPTEVECADGYMWIMTTTKPGEGGDNGAE